MHTFVVCSIAYIRTIYMSVIMVHWHVCLYNVIMMYWHVGLYNVIMIIMVYWHVSLYM